MPIKDENPVLCITSFIPLKKREAIVMCIPFYNILIVQMLLKYLKNTLLQHSPTPNATKDR